MIAIEYKEGTFTVLSLGRLNVQDKEQKFVLDSCRHKTWSLWKTRRLNPSTQRHLIILCTCVPVAR